jgi:hypothetical protein
MANRNEPEEAYPGHTQECDNIGADPLCKTCKGEGRIFEPGYRALDTPIDKGPCPDCGPQHNPHYQAEEPTVFDEPGKARAVSLLFKVDLSEADRIDALAEQMGMNRSRFIRYRTLLPVGPVPIGGSAALETAYAALGEALGLLDELLKDAPTTKTTRRVRRASEGIRALYAGNGGQAMKAPAILDENGIGAVLGFVRRNSPSLEILDFKMGRGTTSHIAALGLITTGDHYPCWHLSPKGAETLDHLRAKWRRLLRDTEAPK